MIGKVDFDKDLIFLIPLQSTTQVSYDYRRNDYKELDMGTNPGIRSSIYIELHSKASTCSG